MEITTPYNIPQHAMKWLCQNPAILSDITNNLHTWCKTYIFSHVMIIKCSLKAHGWNLDSMGFPYSLKTPKTEFRRRSYGHLKLEAMTIVSHPGISVPVQFERIFEFQGVRIWIYLFHGDMFSYQSSSSTN